MITLPFRNWFKNAVNRQLQSVTRARSTKKIDPKQEAALNEKCFLLNNDDKVIGQATKKECHTVNTECGDIPLHRAFSLFLFNKKGDLLLQKRSAEKVTYPNCYTNSCCSHPLADIPGEEDESEALGVRRAAQRRLKFELGIPVEKVPLEKINYITRIHYKDQGNGKWGEHEIDYVLFLQDDLPINPNPNEISEISFVPRDGLDDYLPTLSGRLTPWFQLILHHRLRLWWDSLDDLSAIEDHKHIIKLGDKSKD